MNFTIKTGDGGLKFTNEAPWQITITFLKRGKLVSMYILTNLIVLKTVWY